MNEEYLSDGKLFYLCRKFGYEALHWRGKFLGLLPEVYRRRLYEKKNFSSIFEFAKKLAGISEEQVRMVLNIDKKFTDKPLLKAMLESGEVSINKLSRVASIATPENQDFLATQVRLLTQAALETLARDARQQININNETNSISINQLEDPNGFLEPGIDQKSVHAHTNLQYNPENANLKTPDALGLNLRELSRLNISLEIIHKLLELQNKGIDINQLLLDFIERREQEIEQEQEKEKLSEEIQSAQGNVSMAGAQAEADGAGRAQIAQGNASMHNAQSKASMEAQALIAQGKASIQTAQQGKTNGASHYIPAKIKQLIQKEYGTKCSMPTCAREAENIHHTQRFALSKTHDPKYLAPLCKDHHQIAHSIDLKFQEARVACRAPRAPPEE